MHALYSNGPCDRELPCSGEYMPADILTNADGFFPAFLGFWRFVLSAQYRADTKARWGKREGVAKLVTVVEVLGCAFLGLVLPLVMGITGLIVLTR